jgi:hypothetical protein
MSKVNVSLQGVFTAPANVLVTVKSVLVLDQNVVVGTVGALPEQQSKRTDSSGRVAGGFDLLTGRYEVSAQSSSIAGVSYRVVIDVPNDASAYEHTQLIVSGAAPFSQPISTNANASDVSYGLVRLTSNGKAIPESVDTLALLRAVVTSRAAVAQLAFVFGGAAVGDGAGGLYRWDGIGTDADDGAGVIRPGDFGSAGVWRKWL